MSLSPPTRSSLLARLLALLICSTSLSLPTYGQIFGWTGGGSSNNWSDPNNWGGVVPPSGETDLLFGLNSLRHNAFNDLGIFDLETLFFANSNNSYALFGDPLRFSAPTPQLHSLSGAHSINNAIWVTQPLEVQVNTNGQLDLNGDLLGTRAITKGGAGLLVVGGDNGSWSGDLNITAGTVRFDAGDALSVDTNVHVAAGATADFSPSGEGFGGFSGEGHLEFGNTVDIFSHFTNSLVFTGTASGANAHLRKQGPASMLLRDGANVNVDQITVEEGTVSVESGAAVTTANKTTVNLGATLSLAADASYHAGTGMLVMGTLNTSGGDISLGQFSSVTIREFGQWNLGDTESQSTTFSEAVVNVNDSAVLNLSGDVTFDHSFLNIEDNDLLQIDSTGVEIRAHNLSSIIIGPLDSVPSQYVHLDRDTTVELTTGSTLRVGSILFGDRFGKQAEVLADGAGTLIRATSAIEVGSLGKGRMSITGGARAESVSAVVGFVTNGVGQLTISGSDSSGNPSSWIVDRFTLGAAGGQGQAEVLEGGRLAIADDLLLQHGTLLVNGHGSEANPSQVTVGGMMHVTGSGNERGELTVSGGAAVLVTGSATIGDGSSLMLDGGKVIVDGHDVQGNASRLTIGGGLRIGSITANSDQLIVSGGAAVEVAGAVRIGHGSGTPSLIVTGTGSSFVQSGAELFSVGVLPTIVNPTSNAGWLTVEGGTLATGSGQVTVSPLGHVVVSGGTLHLNGPMTIAGGTVNLEGGAFEAPAVSIVDGGVFNFTGGRMSVESFQSALINQGGTLAPGSSAGHMVIQGDYTQQLDATLEIEIGGTAVGTLYDFVDIGGTALLDGSLQLALINGFLPSSTDTFTVLNADDVLGFFDDLGPGQRVTTLDGLGSFLVHYGPTSPFNPNQIWLSDFLPTTSGDFNSDGVWDCADINALTAVVAAGTHDGGFDLNGDGLVDLLDVSEWLAEGGAMNPAQTGGNPFLHGDANLDGAVNGADFILWNANKFTAQTDWCGGNFSGDGAVNGGDFIIWNANKFTSSDATAPAAVPEPAGLSMLLAWMLLLCGRAGGCLHRCTG